MSGPYQILSFYLWTCQCCRWRMASACMSNRSNPISHVHGCAHEHSHCTRHRASVPRRTIARFRSSPTDCDGGRALAQAMRRSWLRWTRAMARACIVIVSVHGCARVRLRRRARHTSTPFAKKAFSCRRPGARLVMGLTR